MRAGKGLELESFLLPLAAWFAGAVQRTETSVDGTLVRLRTKLMRVYQDWSDRRSLLRWVRGAVDSAVGAVKCQYVFSPV